MAATTPNMSLVGWNLGGDPYDHSQLYANFVALDAHDHTTGHGVQIPTGGIANLAITAAKLADGAVTSAKLADGAVTAAKLDPTAVAWRLGDVKWQWFPSGGSPIVDTGWHIADGSILNSSQQDWGGTVTLPNLISAFPFGATGAGVGASGGANSLNLSHSHAVAGHSHVVNAHAHNVNGHTHSVDAHTHSISADGNHSHTYQSGKLMHTRESATLAQIPPDGSHLQTMYIAGYNTGGGDAVVSMDITGQHSHGGATGSATSTTGSSGSTTDAATPGTDSVALTTGAALTSLDTRPAYVGLIPLIKVRN